MCISVPGRDDSWVGGVVGSAGGARHYNTARQRVRIPGEICHFMTYTEKLLFTIKWDQQNKRIRAHSTNSRSNSAIPAYSLNII